MKIQVRNVNAAPEKRLFWSIISDYNINTAICELIDNALDIWVKAGRKASLDINIILDTERQLITIQDTSGGVPEEDLRNLVTPGASKNHPDESIIGLFGVGTKRAVVALAQETKITSRNGTRTTFRIEIDEEWLNNETWEIPVYEVDAIVEGTTTVDMSRLRVVINADTEANLRLHLSETYGLFLLNHQHLNLTLNGSKVEPVCFENWAYPPGFQPRCYLIPITTPAGETVSVEMIGGLIIRKEGVKDDYGVYFYCNDRLIAKELKCREVGYISGLAGVPHSDASLARVIVKLQGAAKLMPWNSSKSSINFGHHIFAGLEHFLTPVVKDYSSLSRRFRGRWEEEVFKFNTGEVQYPDVKEVTTVRKSYLPPLPKVRKQPIDHLKAKNISILKDKPWTLGFIESVAAVDLIRRQKFDTKNRMALILLDSSFEIAMKEYIVHTDGLNLGKRSLEEIFKNRHEVIKIVEQKIKLGSTRLNKISHYYGIRNKLIHEKATVDVTDTDISNYLETVEQILTLLFGLSF